MSGDLPSSVDLQPTLLGKRSSIVVGALGTTLEWYDFTLFIYLAPVISHVFFPAHDSLSLLETFGLFAAGYLMRPLGGVFFGRYGDKFGRKSALVLSIAMMSLPMLVTGFIPSYQRIGIIAPMLLLAMRLAQGFSVGGEFSGSIVLLYEYASSTRKGFISNLAQVTAGAGFLLSSLAVTIMDHALSPAAMEQWGWRVLFFVGVVIGVSTLIAQLRMPETESFQEAKNEGEIADSPTRMLWGTARMPLVKVFLLMGYLGMTYYVVATFIPAWLTGEVGRSAADGAVVATIGALLYTVLTPFAGLLSDRIGRRRPMFIAALLLIVVSYPLFHGMVKGGLGVAIASQCILMALVIVFTGASTPAIAELFETSVRYSGVAIGYGLGIAVFGGTAPFLGDAFVRITGLKESPSFLLMVGSILVLFLLRTIPETLPGRCDALSADALPPDGEPKEPRPL
jgi:MHS family proline/betaine transporter-like MFS transporter